MLALGHGQACRSVVVGACRLAGFEPALDEPGAGAAVWCDYIARGRGVGLAVSSLAAQLPPRLALIDLAPPQPTLAINAVWLDGGETPPTVSRVLDGATLAAEHGWL